jgi:hypothetical protein
MACHGLSHGAPALEGSQGGSPYFRLFGARDSRVAFACGCTTAGPELRHSPSKQPLKPSRHEQHLALLRPQTSSSHVVRVARCTRIIPMSASSSASSPFSWRQCHGFGMACCCSVLT